MTKRAGTAVVLGVLVGFAGQAFAAQAFAAEAEAVGDAQAGRTYALEVCADCHKVTPDAMPRQSGTGAPDFQAIADEPTATATGLSVFLLSPHPTMPNLIIPDDDRHNVIAYLLSLKK